MPLACLARREAAAAEEVGTRREIIPRDGLRPSGRGMPRPYGKSFGRRRSTLTTTKPLLRDSEEGLRRSSISRRGSASRPDVVGAVDVGEAHLGVDRDAD